MNIKDKIKADFDVNVPDFWEEIEIVPIAVTPRLRRMSLVPMYAGLAAAVAIMVALGSMFWRGSEVTPGSHEIDYNEIVGLPVGSSLLIDWKSTIELDPNGCIREITSWEVMLGFACDAVVFAKVIEAQQRESTNPWSRENDESTLFVTYEVISTVWSGYGVNLPQTVTVPFSLKSYKIEFWGDVANRYRVGSVHLVNFYKSQSIWLTGGLAYEVDDKGLVWTINTHEVFTRFNGKPASELAEFISDYTSRENYAIANTNFGKYLRELALIQATVVSIDEGTDEWGMPYFIYTLDVGNVFTDTPASVVPLGEFTVQSYVRDTLEEGKRYLLLIYENQVHGRVPVNDDGTISPLDSCDIFGIFDGYTVAQVAELAKRVDLWYNEDAQEQTEPEESIMTPGNPQYSGDFIYPLESIREPSQGHDSGHPALDFIADKGTPIYAAGDGIVLEVLLIKYGYGNNVTIGHENGYKTQ